MNRIWGMAILCLSALSAQVPDEPLTNSGILRLAEAGYDVAFLTRLISAANCEFDTTVTGLVELRRKGLSQRLIRHMIERNAQLNGEEAPGAGAAARPKTEEASAWYLDGGARRERLDARMLAQDKLSGHLAAVLTMGIKPLRLKAYLLGSTARTRIRTSTPLFDIGVPEGVSIEELVLVRMESRKDRREVEVASAGVYGGRRTGLRLSSVVPIEHRALAGGRYQVRPSWALAPSEYFFYWVGSADHARNVAGRGFDFAIQ